MSVHALKDGWKPDYTLNTTVNLNEIGGLVRDAMTYFHDPEIDTPEKDCLRDVLFDLHDKLYPGSSRILSREESLALIAENPPEPETIEESQSQELLQVDNLLFQALANVRKPNITAKFLTEAREALGLFVAAYDLPSTGWND